MNRSLESGQKTGDERLTTLMNNVNAIRAVSSAVEGTLGPKGLDTMLVDEQGEVIVTNDGVTILELMEVKHPAARMLIKIATAQQEKVGDGTTTATILASALVQEGATQVHRGVPVSQVITGIRKAVRYALARLTDLSKPISELGDPHLARVAYVASRENQDISDLVMEACHLVGYEQLICEDWRLSDLVFPCIGEENEVFEGVLLRRTPVSKQMPTSLSAPEILVLEDALAPEEIDEEALGTETGFQRYLDNKEAFKYNLEKIADLGVSLIVCQRSCDPYAEEFCIDRGITVLHRVAKEEISRLADHTGAKPMKRMGLSKSSTELAELLGKADEFRVDDRSGRVRIERGRGKATATMVVGAATAEVVGERGRIARDAAASVQAAVKGGVVAGGGCAEIALYREIESWRTTHIEGLEGYGVDAVLAALQKPMSQMMVNAGFNPLEKLEEVRASQRSFGSSSIGLDYTTGKVQDLLESGIIDPALVKHYALKAAGEVAESILRIHTVIRMKSHADEPE
ncbi:TCP-1/cpn60 chaperonin family protein [Ammoniphilus sp. CFH 90114]|uniref:TCP-1/cpn60 chaperonin family protein n=1 Tax=Ammoniphilus sp. CFH 90114 TaxID=2493665 RepID=UPI00100E9529|nr:TCP-1/cpn60 chaperonin family protein [Ammoniphilus sp. CFH 90114]RXT14811.1 chaperonin [Ammoniphilus sp. CFH 90114]